MSIKFLFWFNLGVRTLPTGGHKRINWIKGKRFCYTNIIVHRFFPIIPFFQITLKIFRLKKEETADKRCRLSLYFQISQAQNI